MGATVGEESVLPAVGSKELVAALPRLLGFGPGTRVAFPEVAYPTYAVGALLAGAEPVPTDMPEDAGGIGLVWLNSPANPTGEVLSVDRLAALVAWARDAGVVVASDECYLELGWDTEPVSILDPRVCGGRSDGLLAVHSLSKRSNMAGYRFGFAAGDPDLVGRMLEVRKHAGMMVPLPVQAAAIAALGDDEHVADQRSRYRERRAALRTAVEAAGFRVDHGEAGLYLWVTRDEPCWATTAWFAERGILVTPGDFYGSRGGRHVRLAFTATDDRVAEAAARLT